MKFLSWLVTLPITAAFIVFALNNRDDLPVSLWPLSLEVSAPIFVWLYFFFLVGVIFGGVGAWVSGLLRRTSKPSKLSKSSSLKTPLVGESSEPRAAKAPETETSEHSAAKQDVSKSNFPNLIEQNAVEPNSANKKSPEPQAI